MSDHDPSRRASEFLRAAHLYRLGELPTEQPHPETRDLSLWSRTDLPRALDALKRVDRQALDRLAGESTTISALAAEVRATLDRGARVFLCGCGATGRLALSLEYLWRRRGQDVDRLVAFMAGGDVALVHSLEGFEDDPRHGARHLRELGFGERDLLIACTEGGETPYVIGAVEAAASTSSTPPWFLYCNPDEALLRTGSRFGRVHADPRIRKASLYVGPMALAGSTRMQASTALELAVGAALLHPERSPGELVRDLDERLRATDLAFLEPFVVDEAEIYRRGDHVLYRVRDYGITVFTDTTERAPTFSLPAFERANDPHARLSPCYVQLDDAETADDAWVRLLARPPRPLAWPEVDTRATRDYLESFDFGPSAAARRRDADPARRHHEFRIAKIGATIDLALEGRRHALPLGDSPELIEHLLLKQLLNMHSTLVMGRLGRYEGNWMTWVTPTNGKLLDRAARHVRHLLAHAGEAEPGYEEIVRQLFIEIARTAPGEPVVLRTFRALAAKEAGRRRA
jgi:N-acetylmuramic acid 6-phosphate etherase